MVPGRGPAAVEAAALPESGMDLPRHLETQERETYMVVLAEMMDIEAGHISLASPLGRALKGRKVGDELELRLPRGTRSLRVLEISQA